MEAMDRGNKMTDAEFEQSNIDGDDDSRGNKSPPTWIAPAPHPAARRSHRMRTSALVGAAVVTMAAVLGLGRAGSNGSPPVSASPSSMSAFPGLGSNSSGTSASSSSTATGSGPTDVSSIAAKVDPGLVDIDTVLGFQEEEAAGTGIVLTSSGEVL